MDPRYFDEADLPETASDVESRLREFLNLNVGAIPPSEQAKISPDIKKALSGTIKPGHSLFYQTFNMRDPGDAYQVEQLLMNKGVQTLSTDLAWSPSGDLVYVMMCQVTNGIYQDLRKDYVPKPEPAEAEDPEPSTLWERIQFRVFQWTRGM